MKKLALLLILSGCGAESNSSIMEKLPIVSFETTCEVATCAGDEHRLPIDGEDGKDQACVWNCALYEGRLQHVEVRWFIDPGAQCFPEPKVTTGGC